MRAISPCSPPAIPPAFDPDKTVWRLEFQIRREGMKSFRLAPQTDEDGEAEDLDLQVAAELSAEELPHLATFPKLFAHADAFFQHLTAHWLRLTTPGRGKVRSRWPTDPTWEALRRDFARLADAPPWTRRGASWCGRTATKGGRRSCVAWHSAWSRRWKSRMPRSPPPRSASSASSWRRRRRSGWRRARRPHSNARVSCPHG